MTEQFCWLPKTEQLDIKDMSSVARAPCEEPNQPRKVAFLGPKELGEEHENRL